MKKLTHEQIIRSKAIYHKHAARYKANGYPIRRALRMMAYTSLLTQTIAKAGERCEETR
ncbi:hypothetical protein [Metasolibacillus meyeri]|uniref:hypothetical protein n=1 Tax=Metasolibacillus meyeri TaxID=1071052 RepID=UPI00187D2B98|nr:hypothetical protein [Metasolibacillus meyeri]